MKRIYDIAFFVLSHLLFTDNKLIRRLNLHGINFPEKILIIY